MLMFTRNIWPYYDSDSFSLLFELCDNMDLFWLDTRLGGKCKGYNNLANFNCDREHFGK